MLKIEMKMEEDKSLIEFTEQMPDDNSGSRSDNRFGYQVNWALKKLLDLEELGRDYMIIMDYHEDVIVLDSSSRVENIDFYQIKSKRMDYWLLSELTEGGEPANEEGTNKLSILGKLLKNSTRFSKSRYFFFVTDSFFSKNIIKPGSSNEMHRLPFKAFDDKKQQQTKDALKKELKDIPDEVWERVYFLQKQLSVENYRNELVGAITRFFEKKLPDVDIKASTFYDSIIGELDEKQRYEDIITETDVLTTRKSFKHEDFKRYLDGLINFESYDQRCNTILTDIFNGLSKKEMPLKRKMRFKELLHNRIKADYHNYSNAEIIQLKGTIKKLAAMAEFMDDEDATEWTAANKVLEEIKKSYNNYMGYEDDYILALILLEYA